MKVNALISMGFTPDTKIQNEVLEFGMTVSVPVGSHGPFEPGTIDTLNTNTNKVEPG